MRKQEAHPTVHIQIQNDSREAILGHNNMDHGFIIRKPVQSVKLENEIQNWIVICLEI
jgi:hypothetical protein